MTEAQEQRRPRGGQVKDPSVRKRNNLTFRARDGLKAALETAATKSSRSVSEEIEHRLEMSLAQEDFLRRQWGDDVFRLAEGMHRALSLIEHVEGKLWTEDEETYELFRATVPKIARNYRDLVHQRPRAVPTGSFEGKSREELSEMFAAMAITPPRPKRESPPPPQPDVEPRNTLAERMGQMLAEDSARGADVSDTIPDER